MRRHRFDRLHQNTNTKYLRLVVPNEAWRAYIFEDATPVLDLDARTALHNCGTDRVADAPGGCGSETTHRKKERQKTSCGDSEYRNAPGPPTGHNFDDIPTPRPRTGRVRAERADPRRRPGHTRRGRAPAKNPRGKAVGGGRDPQNKLRLRTFIGMFISTRIPGIICDTCAPLWGVGRCLFLFSGINLLTDIFIPQRAPFRLPIISDLSPHTDGKMSSIFWPLRAPT